MNTMSSPRIAGLLRAAVGSVGNRISALFRDRVVIAFVLAMLVVALYDIRNDTRQAFESLVFVVDALVGIAPFLLLAVVISAFASASGADRLIARAFSGSPGRTVLLASLMGALSPFCSCGVIPLIAAMLRAGVPLAPVMAFWLASPVMDPEMFVLTVAGVGSGFAVAKTLAGVVLGLLGGFAVLAIERAGGLRDPLAGAAKGCCGSQSFVPGSAIDVHWRVWSDPARRERFLQDALKTGLFLGKWLSVAFLAESLMLAWLPAESVAQAVGGEGPLTIALAAVVGAPAYLNGYAGIPLISGLIEMGMSGGAALAFATSGAVSSIPAAIAVWALVRRSVFGLYIGLGLGGAILSGYAYQLLGAPI
ncbi:permease [Thioalkalivibrio sp. HK1]|uniref:permease n=1 Tax=Thioalkalivibrio sp. HK1 TaxID=1469245 RepID=UPI0018CC6B33|nr:permease [Thioalkalivibrio sp. HK1]